MCVCACVLVYVCVTLEHKTSHKGQFFIIIEIYTSSERWINKLPIDVWFVKIGHYLAEIQLQPEFQKSWDVFLIWIKSFNKYIRNVF